MSGEADTHRKRDSICWGHMSWGMCVVLGWSGWSPSGLGMASTAGPARVGCRTPRLLPCVRLRTCLGASQPGATLGLSFCFGMSWEHVMHRYHLHVPGLGFDASLRRSEWHQMLASMVVLLGCCICLPVYILGLSRWWSGKVTVARLGSHRGSTPLGASHGQTS